MKLATKLSLAIAAGSLLGLVAIGLTAYLFTRSALEHSLIADQSTAARQILEQIDRHIYERASDIAAMAGNQPFEAFLSREAVERNYLQQRLNELSVITGPWDFLMLVNRTGEVVLSTEKMFLSTSVDTDFRTHNAFVAAMHGNAYYSDAIPEELTGKTTILLSQPIRNKREPRAPVIGVIIGSLAWPAVVQILENTRHHAMLVDRTGAIIAQNAAPQPDRIVANLPIIENALKGQAAHAVLKRGRKNLLQVDTVAVTVPQKGYLTYQGSGWALLLEQPLHNMLASSRESALKLTLFIAPGVLLMAAGIGWIVRKIVTRPLAVLTGTTQAFASGDLTQRVKISSTDELGQLASSFNTMADGLQASYANLEAKVLERTAELEKSNKELDEFTYIISHDLKEPLRSIDAFSKFVAEDYREQLGEEGGNYISRVRDNAKRLHELIEDLLELSRLSRKPNEFQQVDILDVLKDIKLRFGAVLEQKRIDLLISPAIPSTLCDRVRIGEVFANLISNAIKYNDKAKCVITIGCRDEAEARVFYVQDNGPGISAQYHAKIFEIFQRLNRREDQEGTGVGLTIVKKIVDLHKGRVWVESKVGDGATFFFTIPKKEEPCKSPT